MLGIVFTTLVEMLEESVSADFADEVLDEANLENGGSFTAVGYYPFSELVKVLDVLQRKTGKSLDELLHSYGQYLFGVLASSHASVMHGKHNILDVLAQLDDDIHVQVRKLYPDADLPTFKVIERGDSTMVIDYFSQHDLYALAEGLMDGAAAHFGNRILRTTTTMDEPHHFRFTIKLEDA